MHYDAAYSGADHNIILFDGVPAGRMLVHRSDVEVVLVDISLLPERRGAGIGSALIRELVREGGQSGKPVRLHVNRENRARRLYERLGFGIIEDAGAYFKMERRPGSI
jgi:ribosomal protein S18 acetylase RimI-like enzyme